MNMSASMQSIAPKGFTDYMKRVHVVAAVIYEPQNRVINNAEAGVVGRILISCRPTHVHKGGFWEFPGGKLEIGEDARAGLVR